ncbi:MAG: hypothetical protein ACJA0C_000343 [Candidatus Endobugula sp.]|jgi:hypothetical protein
MVSTAVELTMSENTFDIVFTGDIAGGADIIEVKAKAAQLFRLDDDKLTVLFSGKRTMLKKSIDDEAAQKYQKILNGIGMITVVQVHATTQAKPSPPVNVSPSLTSPSLSRDTAQKQVEVPSSDASFTAAQTLSSAHWNVLSVGEVGVPDALLASESSAQSDAVLKGVDWIIDKPGVQLSTPTKSVKSEVTLPDLSVAPVATDLLDSSEKKATVASLYFSSIETITVTMVGDNLLSEAEKTQWTELPVDISHLEAVQDGGDLLADHEKTVFVEKVIETENIQLIADE